MTLSELFESFETSAFRLEGLPTYSVHEELEAVKHYNEHGRVPSGFGDEWAQFIQQKIAAGKTVQRLRLLSDTPTEYETFELDVYASAKHGEDIRFLKRSNQPYEYDFWLFDRRWLAKMNYDNDGHFIGVNIIDMSLDSQDSIRYWIEAYESAPKTIK